MTIGAILAVAQIMQMAPSQPNWSMGTPRPRPPIITGKPFHAHFETTSQSISGEGSDIRHTSGEIYRNAKGDVRVEYDSGSPTATVAMIQVGGPGAIFQPMSRVIVWIPESPQAVARSEWHFTHSSPYYSAVYKDIQGLRCRRIDFRDPGSGSAAGEAWISEAMGIVMRDQGFADGVAFDWNVTNLTFGDPSPGLFAIPSDYRVVEP